MKKEETPFKYQRVLLVDDNDIDNFINERMITTSSFSEKVIVKNSAEGALEFLRSVSEDAGALPEVIFLDLNMPKKNGQEVLSEIKQHPVFKMIPVIVYTTTKNEDEVKRCYELGANTYIVKPISFESLLQVVQTIRNYWLSTACVPAA